MPNSESQGLISVVFPSLDYCGRSNIKYKVQRFCARWNNTQLFLFQALLDSAPNGDSCCLLIDLHISAAVVVGQKYIPGNVAGTERRLLIYSATRLIYSRTHQRSQAHLEDEYTSHWLPAKFCIGISLALECHCFEVASVFHNAVLQL